MLLISQSGKKRPHVEEVGYGVGGAGQERSFEPLHNDALWTDGFFTSFSLGGKNRKTKR